MTNAPIDWGLGWAPAPPNPTPLTKLGVVLDPSTERAHARSVLSDLWPDLDSGSAAHEEWWLAVANAPEAQRSLVLETLVRSEDKDVVNSQLATAMWLWGARRPHLLGELIDHAQHSSHSPDWRAHVWEWSAHTDPEENSVGSVVVAWARHHPESFTQEVQRIWSGSRGPDWADRVHNSSALRHLAYLIRLDIAGGVGQASEAVWPVLPEDVRTGIMCWLVSGNNDECAPGAITAWCSRAPLAAQAFGDMIRQPRLLDMDWVADPAQVPVAVHAPLARLVAEASDLVLLGLAKDPQSHPGLIAALNNPAVARHWCDHRTTHMSSSQLMTQEPWCSWRSPATGATLASLYVLHRDLNNSFPPRASDIDQLSSFLKDLVRYAPEQITTPDEEGQTALDLVEKSRWRNATQEARALLDHTALSTSVRPPPHPTARKKM